MVLHLLSFQYIDRRPIWHHTFDKKYHTLVRYWSQYVCSYNNTPSYYSFSFSYWPSSSTTWIDCVQFLILDVYARICFQMIVAACTSIWSILRFSRTEQLHYTKRLRRRKSHVSIAQFGYDACSTRFSPPAFRSLETRKKGCMKVRYYKITNTIIHT